MNEIKLKIKLWNQQLPQKGDLLLSSPFLNDSNFDHSVVYLCEFNDEGAFGFVLNQVSSFVLSDLSEAFSGLNEKVFIGGPVETNTLHYLHDNSCQINNSVQISDTISWGGDLDDLFDKIKTGLISSNQVRFFLGYSGWGHSQLIQELKDESWAITSSQDKPIFYEEGPAHWREILKMMGEKYKFFAHSPLNPSYN